MKLVLMMAALVTAAPSQQPLRAFHPGMTQDEARQAAACRLKRPPGRFRANQLSCSGFMLGGVKMTLTLSFTNGVLSEVSLFRGGYAEKRVKQDLEIALRTLAREFGALSSPELGSGPVTAATVFDYLKQRRTYAATSNLSIRTARGLPGLDIAAYVSSSRGAVPVDGFLADNPTEGFAPAPAGSPFDLVQHSITITLRPGPSAPSPEH